MDNVDFLFITNVPSFYKVALYNELHKRKNIFVIFISDCSNIRSGDFISRDINFPHVFLTNKPFEERSRTETAFFILKEIYNLKYIRLFMSGWEMPELMPMLFFLNRRKNSIIIESSIYESKTNGIKGFLKKIYLKRFSQALVSGFLQKELVSELGFKGDVKYSYGVGIPKLKKVKNEQCSTTNNDLNFLYVGRLSYEKNLSLLVDAFKSSRHKLTLVGDGPLRNELEFNSPNNVKFLGYLNNNELHTVYSKHHVLILPSLSEPWGLVVEEALSLGLPVIVSDKVGCKVDLIDELETGVVFSAESKDELLISIENISDNFNFYQSNTNRYELKVRIDKQVQAYVE
ncbi:hypothetical protein IJ23_08285 [Vibrio sp. OY15]|uniref:glycosyltransferase family 4 protein n=1 Tax=Vibrio sp. OY15 TaxID=1440054 RepID=UPI0005087FCA|nr:glycosyltransferase [Vibrio sp. OY15]KFJ87792.1 hypothetical protein IJ23_08285 [Vibrio sp. OY15]